jgi:hypothetical protein
MTTQIRFQQLSQIVNKMVSCKKLNNLINYSLNIYIYLAHVWGAETAAMRRFVEIMVGEYPQPPFLIHKARVRINLRKIIPQSKMIQNRLNEKQVCIAYNPQFTPEN